MRDDDPCPDSDENDDCGYYWTDDTGDNDRMSEARNMGRQLGRHFTNESCSAGLIVYAETSFYRCDRRRSSGKAETTISLMRGGRSCAQRRKGVENTKPTNVTFARKGLPRRSRGSVLWDVQKQVS